MSFHVFWAFYNCLAFLLLSLESSLHRKQSFVLCMVCKHFLPASGFIFSRERGTSGPVLARQMCYHLKQAPVLDFFIGFLWRANLLNFGKVHFINLCIAYPFCKKWTFNFRIVSFLVWVLALHMSFDFTDSLAFCEMRAKWDDHFLTVTIRFWRPVCENLSFVVKWPTLLFY
jgi:hypothetical protein